MTITINKQTAKLLLTVINSVVSTRWIIIEDGNPTRLNLEKIKNDEATKFQVEGLIMLNQSLSRKLKTKQKTK
jgi:hypothetical protein